MSCSQNCEQGVFSEVHIQHPAYSAPTAPRGSPLQAYGRRRPRALLPDWMDVQRGACGEKAPAGRMWRTAALRNGSEDKLRVHCKTCLGVDVTLISMSKELVSDELWEIIEPLLPEEPPKPKGGRPRLDDRAALAGIVFVLKSGIPWEMLPKEMGCGSGSTCWRRLRETGRRQACGKSSIGCSWTAWARPIG